MSSLIAETCDAEAFLNPDNFRTDYDCRFGPESKSAKQRDGYVTGLSLQRFAIGQNGVWCGVPKDGGSLISYERIGYHALTAQFLQGILDSGCPIVVYRKGKRFGQVIRGGYTIKE
jgi:hypothetical protein